MKRLGLGVPRVPTKTAGDRFAEFFLLLGMLSATLGKIGQNVYNLQQTDVDEATEFVEGKVGSSAMPHKLNPVASGSVVLLARLLRARMGPALEYVHCEWEDDHRQGETAWSFAPEVCLLLGAQLQLLERVLRTLVVKPAHMLRNLERSGGVVLSEAVMMALAPQDRTRPRPRARARALPRRPRPRPPLPRGGGRPSRGPAPPEREADRQSTRLPELARPGRPFRGPRAGRPRHASIEN